MQLVVKQLLQVFREGGSPKESEEMLWDQLIGFRWLVSSSDEAEIGKMIEASRTTPVAKAKAKSSASSSSSAKPAKKESKAKEDQAMADTMAMFRKKPKKKACV